MRRIARMCAAGVFLGIVLSFMGLAQALTPPEQTMLAFPAQAAGLSAYVKLERKIAITDALAAIFDRIEDVGDNYIIGTVKVTDFVGNVYPHLYVDTEGWIVAYFLSHEPASWVMYWSGDPNNPNAIIGSTLEKTLSMACEGLKVSMPKVSYCDFRYPHANNMLILLNIFPGPGGKVMYIKLPSNDALYHVAYHLGKLSSATPIGLLLSLSKKTHCKQSQYRSRPRS